MLHEFLTASSDDLLRRCRGKVAKRTAPEPTTIELEHGIPLENEPLRKGFTVDQVVHDHGDLCQSVTELAAEQSAAVTELGRARDQIISDEGEQRLNERLRSLAHELRDLLNGGGLGLSIARRAVEANDGTLTVRNVAGKGCIFTIDLPRSSMN